jgi:hypothetical protein
MYFGDCWVKLVDRWDINGIVELYIMRKRKSNEIECLSIGDHGMTIALVTEGASLRDEVRPIQIPREALSGLAEEIRKLGIETSKEKEYDSVITCLKSHLQDLRKLVFKNNL